MMIKRINLIGLVLALVFVFTSSTVLAQSGTTVPDGDIPPELIQLAQDLGCQSKTECAEKFDADIEVGIDLAQKYDVYTPEQKEVATTFKTEVLERLRTVSQDDFEEEILVLANKILSEKPALARTMGVTQQTVSAAKKIVDTVKEAGVNIRTCQRSPEDLSRQQLIACVRAGNNLSDQEESLGDYIPEGNINKGREAQRKLALEESLLGGEYSGLGRVGIEEAGQICLRPGSESIADCDRIAEQFFGADGVKSLQDARAQTTRAKEYYTGGIEKMELVTPDGRKLIGKGVIKNACNKAFENSNLGLARACGNFAVKNGYSTENEVEDGLKLLETFSQKSQGTNFDDCRFDPESCRDFLPDDFRPRFDSQFEIFKIMSESIGFDPVRCENTSDPDISKRCLLGARQALPRVEEIANRSPEARRIVDEIRSHVNEGDRMTERLDVFHQDSKLERASGPGGCKGPEQCFKYCSQPSNSAECISFGAKSQIFDQSRAVEKFNIVNDRLNNQPAQYPEFTRPREEGFGFRPFPNAPDPLPLDRPGVQPGPNQYPYPQPGRPAGPSPECFAAISSGDFARAKTACSSVTDTYEKNYPQPIKPPFPVCATFVPSPCPAGQMRQATTDTNNCPTFGACVVIKDYKPIDTTAPSCSSNQYWDGTKCMNSPSSGQCPSGQFWYTPPGGGTGYCQSSSIACTQAGGTWDSSSNYCKMPNMPDPAIGTTCASNQWWDPSTKTCKSSLFPTVGSCTSTQYWKPATSKCLPRTNCTDTANSEYNTPECQGVRGLIPPLTTVQTVDSCDYSTQYWKSATSKCLPRTNCTNTANSEYNSTECQGVRNVNVTPVSTSGCGSFGTQATCLASPSCGWANGACGENYTYPTTSGSCPAGYHPHSESGGFCMNDQENYAGTCYNSAGTSQITCPQAVNTDSCASGQYWDGTACVNSPTSGQCPSDQYWNGSACQSSSTACTQAGGTWDSSSNYCQMPNTTPSTSCSSGQYWDGNACVSSSTTTQCPSDQYWYVPPGGGAGYCQSSSSTSSDPATGCTQAGGTWDSSSNYCQMPNTASSTSCSSDQYWDGSSCQSSSTACTQAGGTWDSSSNYCQMPNTTPSTSCSSGQYWDGNACVNTTTSDTPPPPPPDNEPPPPPPPEARLLCNQFGGSWTGAACNLAQNIANQRAYNNYFRPGSDTLVAQVARALVGLFK